MDVHKFGLCFDLLALALRHIEHIIWVCIKSGSIYACACLYTCFDVYTSLCIYILDVAKVSRTVTFIERGCFPRVHTLLWHVLFLQTSSHVLDSSTYMILVDALMLRTFLKLQTTVGMPCPVFSQMLVGALQKWLVCFDPICTFFIWCVPCVLFQLILLIMPVFATTCVFQSLLEHVVYSSCFHVAVWEDTAICFP